jgi:hypothetical protein
VGSVDRQLRGSRLAVLIGFVRWRDQGEVNMLRGGRYCVIVWWARLGAAVHSSDGGDEFGEGLRDPMPWIDAGAKFVMTAVEILDEGVSRADDSRRAQPL